MNRTSGLWLLLGFAVLTVLWSIFAPIDWVRIGNFDQPVKPPTSTTRIEKVIDFCLNSRHENSKLCTVDDPQTPNDFKSALTTDLNQSRPATIYPQQQSSGRSQDIETRTYETVRTSNTKTVPAPAPTQVKKPEEPSDDSSSPINVPVPVKIPVDVPKKIKIPAVGSVEIDDSNSESIITSTTGDKDKD